MFNRLPLAAKLILLLLHGLLLVCLIGVRNQASFDMAGGYLFGVQMWPPYILSFETDGGPVASFVQFLILLSFLCTAGSFLNLYFLKPDDSEDVDNMHIFIRLKINLDAFFLYSTAGFLAVLATPDWGAQGQIIVFMRTVVIFEVLFLYFIQGIHTVPPLLKGIDYINSYFQFYSENCCVSFYNALGCLCRTSIPEVLEVIHK
jgi:hypothetical protein